MDSRLIYSAANSLNLQYEEWVHIGTETETKMNIVAEIIGKTFSEEELLLVLGRTNSEIISLKNSIEKITPHLGKENFFLWDKNMQNVIEFNRIGILRKGILN